MGVALPLLTLMAMDRLDLAIYAAFGAFTGVYARNESPRSRFLREPLAGAAVAARCNLKPAGSVFVIFALAAVGSIDGGAAPWLATLIAFLTAGVSIVLGAGAHLIGERPLPNAVPMVTERLSRRDLLAHGLRFSVAPIALPHRRTRVYRALHRIVGTMGGVVITGFLLSFPSEPWQLVVWVIVFQFLGELYVGRNYSLALLFITPVALLMAQIGSPMDAGPLLAARAVETAIGAVVALAVVIWGFPDEYRTRLSDVRRNLKARRGPR